MEMKHLVAYAAVVRLGSFSRAAEELYIAQPTISLHVRQLEEELQTRLLIRTTKNIEVTEKGREVYEYAMNILQLRDRIVEKCAGGEQRIIRLGASTIPSAYILPEVLPAFVKKHPSIYFTIDQGDSRSVAEKLAEGVIDIGLIGMNEAGLNAKWLRADLTDPKVQQFTKDVLNHMREKLSDYQELYGDLYNLEATPAESTTYRFAKHDRELYPDIITANMNGAPYYTNSSHLPVGFTEDVFSALDIQDELQTLYTSGTVFHAFLGEKLPDWKAAANLVRKIAENYKLPYYTISPTYSVCRDHGYLTGEQNTCPICGKKTEVYSRITGYYRPVQNWNDGKLQEFKDRREYVVANTHASACSPDGCRIDAVEKNQPEDKEHSESTGVPILFTTPTCPNCASAKKALGEAGIAYRNVDAVTNPDLARKYRVMTAPSLVDDPDGDPKIYRGVSMILGWINNK